MANSKNTLPPDTNNHHQSTRLAHYIDRFLDAACDSSRRAILELLIPPDEQDAPQTHELRAGEIAAKLGLAPSTTSEHLHQLLNLHLVSTRKEGTMVYYRLRNRHLVQAFHELLQALETHYHANNTSSEETGTEEG